MRPRVITKPSPNTSVFQKVNHLFLKDKITKQSWVNMNDHKKPWFLTERKPISRSGGLIFFLSLFKLFMFIASLYKLFLPLGASPAAVAEWLVLRSPKREVVSLIPPLYRIFFYLIGYDFSNQQNIIRFVLARSELVENDTSLAYVRQF